MIWEDRSKARKCNYWENVNWFGHKVSYEWKKGASYKENEEVMESLAKGRSWGMGAVYNKKKQSFVLNMGCLLGHAPSSVAFRPAASPLLRPGSSPPQASWLKWLVCTLKFEEHLSRQFFSFQWNFLKSWKSKSYKNQGRKGCQMFKTEQKEMLLKCPNLVCLRASCHGFLPFLSGSSSSVTPKSPGRMACWWESVITYNM